MVHRDEIDNAPSSSEDEPEGVDQSILTVGSRILVLYKGSPYNATIRRRRFKNDRHDFLIHYDGNKRTNLHWILIERIGGILEINRDTPPERKRQHQQRRKAAARKKKGKSEEGNGGGEQLKQIEALRHKVHDLERGKQEQSSRVRKLKEQNEGQIEEIEALRQQVRDLERGKQEQSDWARGLEGQIGSLKAQANAGRREAEKLARSHQDLQRKVCDWERERQEQSAWVERHMGSLEASVEDGKQEAEKLVRSQQEQNEALQRQQSAQVRRHEGRIGNLEAFARAEKRRCVRGNIDPENWGRALRLRWGATHTRSAARALQR